MALPSELELFLDWLQMNGVSTKHRYKFRENALKHGLNKAWDMLPLTVRLQLDVEDWNDNYSLR